MNSAVGPNFNIIFWIKWLWVLWIVHKQCVDSAWTVLYVSWNSETCASKKKKKKKGNT